MVAPEGLEPPTSRLGNACSIRLSYGATPALYPEEGKLGKPPLLVLKGRIFLQAVEGRANPIPSHDTRQADLKIYVTIRQALTGRLDPWRLIRC